MQNAAESAREILADLEHKLAGARERKVETESLLKANAFAANTGDAEARKKQTKWNTDLASWAADIFSLEAAIVEARRRLAAAVAANADAQEQENARQALALLETFATRGAALDLAFEVVLAEYAQLSREFKELDRLGYPATTPSLVSVNMSLAASTKLMHTDMQNAFLAPARRRSFVESIEAWSAHVRAKATARLARNRKAAEAA
jgi:hypothetical protein